MQRKGPRRTLPMDNRGFDIALARIGQDPRSHVQWALDWVERHKRGLTVGDVENLRVELTVFASIPTRWGGREIRIFGAGVEGKLRTPSEEEAREILDALDRILDLAVERKDVSLGEYTAKVGLTWLRDGYVLHEHPRHDWRGQAARALARALIDCGHLLKRCPAPAPREKEGAACGLRFLAKRPNQEYCSATCQSRASTRAFRAGTETPATLKRKASAHAQARGRKSR